MGSLFHCSYYSGNLFCFVSYCSSFLDEQWILFSIVLLFLDNGMSHLSCLSHHMSHRLSHYLSCHMSHCLSHHLSHHMSHCLNNLVSLVCVFYLILSYLILSGHQISLFHECEWGNYSYMVFSWNKIQAWQRTLLICQIWFLPHHPPPQLFYQERMMLYPHLFVVRFW